ncbi:guanosine-3',5'-bis(diphosphate) 3'-pyrophosphohydrolase [Hasllibacter halocynthiae]|uniref:Guanosine-3',5'-bis(Diphosphate) 3'-pyrophosphohydrolase n=1 Tax=Hasllibacter halocynthiae TaxID=595589 RepID=A0A2T0X8R7_9RHOB|nr:HD domain-containing protein [Hasllibacter halocynthiae]PRY95319.1 guanosine-3',5'-bis(diphosphate) 3'-pyrophosphohydrolase [Hasllibacter halocynthiae]
MDAALFAARRHAGQRAPLSGDPYVNHVIEVARRVAAAGADEALVAAAILHDVVEDTDATLRDVEERFGPAIAGIVAEVTDPSGLSEDRRRARQVEHAPRLSDAAKRLKLADKTANLLEVVRHGGDGARGAAYVEWGAAVGEGLRGVDPALEERFDEALAQARAVAGGAA